MNDACAVGFLEGQGNLMRDRQRLAERHCTAAEPRGERLALEPLEDQERRPVVITNIEERADVRVRELRERTRFAIEPRAERLVAGESF